MVVGLGLVVAVVAWAFLWSVCRADSPSVCAWKWVRLGVGAGQPDRQGCLAELWSCSSWRSWLLYEAPGLGVQMYCCVGRPDCLGLGQ